MIARQDFGNVPTSGHRRRHVLARYLVPAQLKWRVVIRQYQHSHLQIPIKLRPTLCRGRQAEPAVAHAAGVDPAEGDPQLALAILGAMHPWTVSRDRETCRPSTHN